MYKKFKHQISYNAIYKILILLLNFPLIKYTIEYLGTENFGIYVALTSLFSWMFLFDLGIAKGLRNYVTKFLLLEDHISIRKFVSTTYVGIFFIALILCFISIFLIFQIDLNYFFNISTNNNSLELIFFILIIGFFIKFYFSIVDQLFYAVHKSHFVSLSLLLTSFINLIGILILLLTDNTKSLLLVVLIFSFSIVIPYILMTYIFFKKFKQYIPAFQLYSFSIFKNIFKSGSKILLIQIGFLFIIGIDRLLLLKYGNGLEVTQYEIIYKIMSIVVIPVSILIAPMWSAFTHAYNENNIDWIKGVFKNFYYLMIFLFCVILILTISFNYIVEIWLDDFTKVETYIVFLMGILILEMIWSNFHSDFLLGIDSYNFIKITVFFGLILKSLFLVYVYTNNTYLSVYDVIVSSILAYIFFSFLAPIYIFKFHIKRF